ncbi:hypothetical protein ACH5RR_031943 [Cinchona calisaya]|uniref:Uncharacterized protein n=1 Tax=Cinchona calisaya TaxID=153742 RepID=A0ABD2YIL7_9GENT
MAIESYPYPRSRCQNPKIWCIIQPYTQRKRIFGKSSYGSCTSGSQSLTEGMEANSLSINLSSHANAITEILGELVASCPSQNNDTATYPSQKVVPTKTVTNGAPVHHGVAEADYALPATPHTVVNLGKICFQPVVSVKHI